MQPQPDYLSVPRRALDVEDYIDILRRHWMWIVGPTFASLVIAVVVAFLWPDTFLSYATMRITPAQVSQQIVPPNFNQQLFERMQTMLQDVTSRSKLIEMIKKFNLYPREQAKKPLEDIVEDMRKQIKITPYDLPGAQQRPGSGAFRIAFAYESRVEAQKVVTEIVSSFTSQNVLDRRQKTRITTELLTDVVKNAKAELDRIEGDLTAFKMKNAGSLPEELQTNLQTQRSYEMQLQGIQDALHRGQQDKMMLETNIQNLKTQLNSLVTTETETIYGQGNVRLAEMERDVARMEASVSIMKERLKSDHPDLREALSQLEARKSERDALAAADEKSRQNTTTRRVTNAQALSRKLDLEAQMKSAQSRIHAINIDMDERMKLEKEIGARLSQINQRIQSNPLMQGEYARLTRDYNMAKANYDELVSKKSRSEVANVVEERSAGENLEVLDPASLPQKPSEPNRWIIVAAGLGMGIVLGVFLAGAQEVKDSTMKGLKDVRAYTNAPVLSSIPLLENALLVRRKRRLSWLAWSSAMIVGIVAMAGSVYYYYWGR